MTSWSFYKALFRNADIKTLLYGTFTTLISVMIIRGGVLHDAFPDFVLINPSLIIVSAILFFISGVFWFIGSVVHQVALPALIRDNTNINEYLEKVQKTVGDPSEWASIEIEKVEEWQREDFVKGWVNLILVVLLVVASVCFLFGVAAFFAALHQFLPVLIQRALGQ